MSLRRRAGRGLLGLFGLFGLFGRLGIPGRSAAHTVLLIRPDGHLVTALNGVRAADLYAAAEAAVGGPTGAQEASAAGATAGSAAK